MASIITQNGYPTIKTAQFANTKFFPLEIEQINDLGLTLSALQNKFRSTDTRARKRNGTPVPRNQFLRALVYAVKTTAARTGKSPSEILTDWHIHSTNFNDYTAFQLLPPSTHRELHRKHGKRIRCTYCGELKTVSELRKAPKKDKKSYIRTCTVCHSRIRKEQRAIRAQKEVA